MSKIEVACDVVVHGRVIEWDDSVSYIEERVTNLADLETILVTIGEMSGELLYIEDRELKPAVDRFLYVMKHGGTSFVSKDGVYYYYIEGQAFKFKGPYGPSHHSGDRIEEYQMRVAVQSHINSLTGHECEEELSYIEDKYNTLTGENIAIGQTSIYDYIEEETG